jgi:hypothetical protein
MVGSSIPRASARAYVRLAADVRAPDGLSWTGRTRDLSKGGTLVFVEPPYPTGGCELTLELPGGALTLSAEVRFTIPGVGVGLQFRDVPVAAQQRIDQVVEAASATFGLWGMVGKYFTESDTKTPLRLPGPSESIFAELRASLSRAANTPARPELSHHVLHPVGENGMAYQVLFTRPGCVAPSECDLAGRVGGFVRAVTGKVDRVAPQEVWLKLHAGSSPKPYRLVSLRNGGYAAVVVSEVSGAPPRISLLTLALGEQIAVQLKGQPLYPNYTDAELEMIRLDSVRDRQTEPATAAVPPPVDFGAPKARFSDFQPFRDEAAGAIRELLAQDPQTEVRNYGNRAVTLHPHVLLKVRDTEGTEHVGVPLNDGKRLCLLQLTQDGFGRVLPLSPDHLVSVLLR